jgi:hypothetical protein
MELIIGLLVLSHAAVAWGAVRLFQYGLLYGRHWNFQEKTNDAPTVPSQIPSKAKAVVATGFNFPQAEEMVNDFRSEQMNPFAEPAIGGKDAIPPAPMP